MQSTELLPNHHDLPIHHLIQIFQNTSASYKFILFKVILDKVTDPKRSQKVISFHELTIRSICEVLYSIETFKFNLGHHDQFVHWIKELEEFKIKDIIKQGVDKTEQYLLTSQGLLKKTLHKITKKFSTMVPYRLLRPWFQADLGKIKDYEVNRKILLLSQNDPLSLYQIHTMIDERVLTISVNDYWIEYLVKNEKIIRGWWLSQYVNYLQKKNPTMHAIQNKLNPPLERDMSRIKGLYKKYYKFKKVTPICIYSMQTLDIISHDHVIPWSFLGADPLYNFVPTSRSINSSKSDQILHLDYLPTISKFQYEVFDFIRTKEKKYLDEFVLDLKFDQDIFELRFENFDFHYQNHLRLLSESAIRQGFTGNWSMI